MVRTVKARADTKSRASRPAQGGRPSQGWKSWFVFRLAAFWHIIIAEQPGLSPDGHFARLVAAAWNSLDPNIADIIQWDSFVRRYARSASIEEAVETARLASACVRRATEIRAAKTYPLLSEVWSS